MSNLLFVKTLPQQLSQPTTLAVVASLGIHTLLALALPNISKASKQQEQNARGNVKVVQLTPAEESRVPSLAPSPSSVLPPLAYQSQPLPPLPPPPSFSYPPLPSISYPPLPSYPSALPKPDDFSLTPKGSKSSKLSKGTKAQQTKGQRGKQAGIFDNFQIYDKQIFQKPLSNNQQNKSGDRLRVGSKNSLGLKPDTFTPSAYDQVTPPPPPSGSLTPPPPPPSSATPPRLFSKSTELPSFSSNPAPPPASPGNPAPPSVSNPISSSPTPDSIAPKSAPSSLLALQERQKEMRQQYAYNPEGTSDGDAKTNGLLWTDRVKKLYPKLTRKSVITDSIDYPREMLCPKNEPQAAEVIVVVDREGKIVDGPELTRSTGYSILDKAVKNAVTGALDEARKRDRPQTGENEYTAYPFRFKVNKASCRSGQQPISMSAK